jgi:23S rRNA (guanine745-N1)-methyltransferase
MLEEAVGLLRCPQCSGPLGLAEGSLRCASGHSFDVARQGYVNLLPGDARAGTADTPGMVAAREAFLDRGHYLPVARAAAAAAMAVPAEVPGCVVDVGAGTGYYASGVLDALPDRPGLALDISKHAAKRAARAHVRLQAVVCDAWRGLPVRSGAAALVLDVFAPRNAPEFHRVLAPGGALVVVTPTPRHLQELVAVLPMVTVDPDKDERLEAKLSGLFDRASVETVEQGIGLTHADVASLVAMGPSSRHADAAALAASIAVLPEPVSVTLSVNVSIYRPT